MWGFGEVVSAYCPSRAPHPAVQIICDHPPTPPLPHLGRGPVHSQALLKGVILFHPHIPEEWFHFTQEKTKAQRGNRLVKVTQEEEQTEPNLEAMVRSPLLLGGPHLGPLYLT